MLHKKRHKKKKELIGLHRETTSRAIKNPPQPEPEDYSVEDGGPPGRAHSSHDDDMDDDTDDFSVTGQRF